MEHATDNNDTQRKDDSSFSDAVGRMAVNAVPTIVEHVKRGVSPILNTAADAVMDTVRTESKKKLEEAIATTSATIEQNLKDAAEAASESLSSDDESENEAGARASNAEESPNTNGQPNQEESFFSKHFAKFKDTMASIMNLAISSFANLLVQGLKLFTTFLSNIFGVKKEDTSATRDNVFYSDNAGQNHTSPESAQGARRRSASNGEPSTQHTSEATSPSAAPASNSTGSQSSRSSSQHANDATLLEKVVGAGITAVAKEIGKPIKDGIVEYISNNQEQATEAATRFAKENVDVARNVAIGTAQNLATEHAGNAWDTLKGYGSSALSYMGFGGKKDANNADHAFAHQAAATPSSSPTVERRQAPVTPPQTSAELRSSRHNTAERTEDLSNIPGGPPRM